MSPPPARRLAVPLFVAVLLACAPAVPNGFVNWDDPQNILENPYFRGVGPAQVRWAWSSAWLGVYQPIGWMLLGAEYAAFGLDPRGYHLASVLMHAACAVGLYGLILDLLSRRALPAASLEPSTIAPYAALAALLFAVHPLRVEVVSWVSCQTYLPCALLAIFATRAYLRAHPPDGSRRLGWLIAAFVLYSAAGLTKAPAVSLPAALLVLDAYPLGRLGPGPDRAARVRGCFLEKLPFFAVALVLSVIAVVARESGGSPVPVPDLGLADRLALGCYGVAFLLIKTLVPIGLAAQYPLPPDVSWRDPTLIASMLLVAALTAAAWRLRRRYPGLLAGWACVLVLAAPGVNLVWVEPRLAKDRATYFPSLALAALLAGGLCRLALRGPRLRAAVLAAGLVVSAGLIGLTWRQCRTWRDSVSLWTQVLAAGGGDDELVRTNFGEALATQGRLAEALAQYRAAVRIRPDSARARNGQGAVLSRMGRPDEARACFEDALRLDPGLAEAHNNLGLILARAGDLGAAIPRFREAIRLKPTLAEAHNNLGQALASQGHLPEAAAHFLTALHLRPDFAAARANLAETLARLGGRSTLLDRHPSHR